MVQKIRSRKLPKSIRPEEFKKLIQAVPSSDTKTKIAFLLAYGSGMRISEVMRCSPDDLRKNNSIFIPESKYGVERVVPIPKGWRPEFIKKLPLKAPEEQERSFIRRLQRHFKKYAKASNLNKIYTFHSLRHGFATRALESGVPLNQVQLMLGHSNISTTSIYTKANPTDALKSYEDLF